MKLYGFQPDGWGEYSAFVMAESEAEARIYIRDAIAKEVDWFRHEARNIGAAGYTVTEVGVGEVIFNENS